MPVDLGINVGVIVFSILWGVWEQGLAVHNRHRMGDQAHETDRGSFLWISISVSVGMTMAAMFAFSGIGTLRHPRSWELAGILVIALGFWIRIHAMGTLARHFTHRVTILQDHVLIRDGLYRYVRHPSYAGQILILIGLGTMLANGFALLAAPLFTTVALLLRIAVEERTLSEHFREAYEDYRRSTWRLLPLVW